MIAARFVLFEESPNLDGGPHVFEKVRSMQQ